MRIVASAQAKRGSSRGLVHYIAHSKLDTEREPEKVRELFNAFTDSLSVKSANNSMKVGFPRGRPSNEELHHLVLSFRPDDYRALGTHEKQRNRAIKDATRASMKQLENALNADRLSWAAAVHLNTENPHVHIAIQKQYFTRDIERQVMLKIPREALPHFEPRDGEKVLVNGFLIEAATEKMDDLIERDRGQQKGHREDGIGHTDNPHSERKEYRGKHTDPDVTSERDILRQGIIAQHELRRIEAKITALTDHGDKMRFLVSDPSNGRRRRLSLRDIAQRVSVSETDPHGSPVRQIQTILLKMIAKEATAKAQLQNDAGDTMREADRVRTEYRKKGLKLPVPSFTKDELDMLQNDCLEAPDSRGFSYFERIRSELERSGEIESRSRSDFERIAAEKTISNLRARVNEKNYAEFSDRLYYQRVNVGDKRVSIAQLDRAANAKTTPVQSFVGKLKKNAARLSGKPRVSKIDDETDRLRTDTLNGLDDELRSIKENQKAEQCKARILEKLLTNEPEHSTAEPTYSREQLAEIETLSFRLKLRSVYETTWDEQRALIECAGNDCPAYRKLIKANPERDFNKHKNGIVAGRAVAREIVARVELDKTKEDLESFKKWKRFQKFSITDKTTGSVAFLSLHDVEVSPRGSLLDRTVDELFESREHRLLRRTVSSLVKEREQRLNDEVTAAKAILAAASSCSSEFKQFSFFSLRGEPTHQPIFTSSEMAALEIRAANMRDPKGSTRLRAIIESGADQAQRSLSEILRDFASPEMTPGKYKERDPVIGQEKTRERGTEERTVLTSQGLSR